MPVEPITAIAGGALGLAGGIGSMFANRRANRELDKLLKQNPVYQANPIASQRLGLAQSLLNARMPGAASVERNIYGAQANQLANINQNATDASQALALASAVQGQTNNAFQNLGIQEAQQFQQRYNNLSNAQEGMINEGDKAYQDQIRRFQDLAAIRGAQAQNRQANWATISNMGGSLMNFGLSGGMGGLFPQQQGGSGGQFGGAALSALGMIPV